MPSPRGVVFRQIWLIVFFGFRQHCVLPQTFGCAQRPDASGRGLRVHVYEMELAETCLRAVSPVEA